MAEQERRHYARYYIIRGNQALWKGNAAEKGAQFRQVFISSDEFFSAHGAFQVCALEGTGNGIQDGKLSIPPPKVLLDKDFKGLDEAAETFNQVIKQAQAQGFNTVTLLDELEFQSKLKRP